MKMNRGLFARVLVDIDLLSSLPNQLLNVQALHLLLMWNINDSLHFSLTVR